VYVTGIRTANHQLELNESGTEKTMKS